MRTHRGIFIAQDGKSVGRGSNRYESDRQHLQVSLIKDPVHMDVPPLFAGGTALSGGASTSQTETLKTIKHNLPYTPELLIYFYAYSYGGSTTAPQAGGYYADYYVYSGSLGTVTDILFAEVDSQNVYIKHKLDVGSSYVGTYTSDADDYQIRMKYFILSNDSHLDSYTTL